ncbi:hypothetical protein COLO4_06821 [Corchorus olitorius]|uniref:Uncharacterized protein n=1 Tax=Corchorus olitorius TaxID=93759 RepID=A0A1R3KLV5_9ROSI|nr:hypothetical protein COLO4_06821 [Corchorus olitorius]
MGVANHHLEKFMTDHLRAIKPIFMIITETRVGGERG